MTAIFILGNNEAKLIYTASYGNKKINIYEQIDWTIELKRYSKFSIFEADRITEYLCKVIITRFATVGDDLNEYNKTVKEVTYLGYDDNNLNSRQRAYLDLKTECNSYTESMNYFNNLSKQVIDAYNLYSTHSIYK